MDLQEKIQLSENLIDQYIDEGLSAAAIKAAKIKAAWNTPILSPEKLAKYEKISAAYHKKKDAAELKTKNDIAKKMYKIYKKHIKGK